MTHPQMRGSADAAIPTPALADRDVRPLAIALPGPPFVFWLASTLMVAIHAIRFLRLPLDAKVTFVPDDGFYYLGLGRHFATSRVWTWDGGVSRATGFHLLHGYVCALE